MIALGHHSLDHYPIASETSNSLSALLAPTSTELLQDILENVRMDSNGNIRHLHYPNLPENPDFVEHLQQLPEKLKQSYLTLHLRNFLHNFYFLPLDWRTQTWDEKSEEESSEIESGESGGITKSDTISHPLLADLGSSASKSCAWDEASPLANHFYQGLDVHFYDALVRSNQGEGYFEPGWRVIKTGAEQVWVQKDRLTLVAERVLHLAGRDRDSIVGDDVALRLPTHQLEGDRYQAIGNQGLPLTTPSVPNLQLFLNLPAASAAPWIAQATEALNTLEIPFQLQVFNIPDAYEYRCDTCILEISRRHWNVLQPLIAQWSQSLALRPQHLPLSHGLMPGISVVELPHLDSGKTTESNFALHRCGAIAQALTLAQQFQQTSMPGKLSQLRSCFEAFQIDWNNPACNRGGMKF